MNDKSDLINSMVNIFEQYGREYTIEQAMQHVADYCNKQFVEQACEAIDELDGDDRVIFKVEAQQAVRDKFK